MTVCATSKLWQNIGDLYGHYAEPPKDQAEFPHIAMVFCDFLI